MDKKVNERILALVEPEYLKRIPIFVRKHATQSTCKLIEQSFPTVYAEFQKETVSVEAENQMKQIVNDIFEERIKKHNL